MPPSAKQRLDDFDSRLNSIETTLEIKPPRPKSAFAQFREHAWQKIKANKATIIPTIAIVVAVGGWFGSGWFKYWLDHKDDAWNRSLDDRIKQSLEAKGGIKETLANIQQTVQTTDNTLKTLSPFIHDVILHQFENASKLPANTLGERLPAVRNLIAVAKNQGIKIEPGITTSLSKKLLRVQPESPDFWDVAGALISYRSFNTTSWTPPANLPNCTDSRPYIDTFSPGYTSGGQPLKLEVKLGSYRDCRLTLDSPQDGERLNLLLFGDVPVIGFYHCVIVYRGGPVKLALAWDQHVVASATGKNGAAANLSVSGNALTFKDCLFDFSVNQSQPPSQVQQLTRLVLGQDTPTIRLPLAAKAS